MGKVALYNSPLTGEGVQREMFDSKMCKCVPDSHLNARLDNRPPRTLLSQSGTEDQLLLISNY